MPNYAERKTLLRRHRWTSRSLALDPRVGVNPSTVWRAIRHGEGSLELKRTLNAVVGAVLFPEAVDPAPEAPSAPEGLP